MAAWLRRDGSAHGERFALQSPAGRVEVTALADGRYAVAHIPKLGLYAASQPVFSATGEGIVLIETRVSSAQVDRDVRALRLRLLWLAAFLGLIALFGGVLLGRRVTQPTEALTARIASAPPAWAPG